LALPPLCYSSLRTMASTKQRRTKPALTLVGAGNLAHALGSALAEAGYPIATIVVRNRAASIARARSLARKLGAQIVPIDRAELQTELLWLCVRDDAITVSAAQLAACGQYTGIAFHSSGALSSSALDPLRAVGAKVASVHPLMTFVAGAAPSLKGVWFGMEGDTAALRTARKMVGDLGGEALLLRGGNKALYHAWGAFNSPLLIALLAAAAEVAEAAGISRPDALRAAQPLVRRTIQNFLEHGPAAAFSGPLARGDLATVAHHLNALRELPHLQAIYVALARAALRDLPVRHRAQLRRLLGEDESAS
jgi:predicted short-subunit dehydrogenase-like oxidoreductase (DUF2520 family)